MMRRASLAPRSRKKTLEYRQYAPAVAAFLKDNPACQFPLGCGQRSVDVHHLAGRVGKRLTDQGLWRASCRAHNELAENEPAFCNQIGWRLRRVP